MAKANRIYALEIDYENFKSFVPSDMAISVRCKGEALNWKDALAIETDEEDIGMPEADISLLNIGSFVISADLRQTLSSISDDGCEYLPLVFRDRNYFLVNVIRVADCLDKSLSEFNPYGGVRKIVFDANKVPKSGFFKITEDNCTTIFCAADIHDLFMQNSLTGVDFEEFPIA